MSGKIIIADPIVTNRMSLKLAFTREFFEVILIDQVANVISSAVHHQPDVIVLSVEFDKKSAFEACSDLKKHIETSHIPIVLSCSAVQSLCTMATVMRADDVICAASDKQYLVDRVRQLCHRKTELDTLIAHLEESEVTGFAEPKTALFSPGSTQVNISFHGFSERLLKSTIAALTNSPIGRFFNPVSVGAQSHCDGSGMVIYACGIKPKQRELKLITDLRDQCRKANIPMLFVMENTTAKQDSFVEKLGVNEYFLFSEDLQKLPLRIASLLRFFKQREHLQNLLTQRIELATKDALTGLHNRRYAMNYLTKILDAARDSNRRTTIMMLDIDNFKSINDEYGHVIGDKVLQNLSLELQSNLRRADLVSRIGGEEFLIIFTHGKSFDVTRIADRLLSQIRQTNFFPAGQNSIKQVTVSIGIATYARHKSGEDFINSADQALYAAKHSGRNQYQVSAIAA